MRTVYIFFIIFIIIFFFVREKPAKKADNRLIGSSGDRNFTLLLKAENTQKKSDIYCKNFSNVLKMYKKEEIHEYINNYQLKKKKYAIFSAAYQYSYDKYYFFINSIMKANYTGSIFLFVHEYLEERIFNYLMEANVKILYIKGDWPFYSEKNEEYILNNTILERYVPKFHSVGYYKYSIIRYLLINALSKVYKDLYEVGLCVDFKDVFIQIDPFSWNIPEGISLFEESRAISYGDRRCDQNWVLAANTSKWYYKDRRYYIINGGQVYFTYPDVLYFFDEFIKLLVEANFVSETSDQAFINIIYYEIEYKHRKITLFHNYFGPSRLLPGDMIYLHEYSKIPAYKLINHEILDFKNGKVVNCDGTIPVLIHFYFYLKSSELTEKEMKEVVNRVS